MRVRRSDRAHISRDSTGRAQRMLGAMLDLTERRRSKEEIRLAWVPDATGIGFWLNELPFGELTRGAAARDKSAD